jgi:hypothetical protein
MWLPPVSVETGSFSARAGLSMSSDGIYPVAISQATLFQISDLGSGDPF